MVKIKLFIVTYRAPAALQENLLTLFNSGEPFPEVHIINNHTQFELHYGFKDAVQVHHNVLRPDFSTGHLARNWNEAIVNGFRSLKQPDCDILVTAQDDTQWLPDCMAKLIEAHKTYSFIQSGVGDNVCSYTPEAIKKIGLWDERYCNIGFQEMDYFFRAIKCNTDKTSINDLHWRQHNPLEPICKRPQPTSERTASHNKSRRYHPTSDQIFMMKWGIDPFRPDVLDVIPTLPLPKQFMFYPYFEESVEAPESKYFAWKHE